MRETTYKLVQDFFHQQYFQTFGFLVFQQAAPFNQSFGFSTTIRRFLGEGLLAQTAWVKLAKLTPKLFFWGFPKKHFVSKRHRLKTFLLISAQQRHKLLITWLRLFLVISAANIQQVWFVASVMWLVVGWSEVRWCGSLRVVTSCDVMPCALMWWDVIWCACDAMAYCMIRCGGLGTDVLWTTEGECHSATIPYYKVLLSKPCRHAPQYRLLLHLCQALRFTCAFW